MFLLLRLEVGWAGNWGSGKGLLEEDVTINYSCFCCELCWDIWDCPRNYGTPREGPLQPCDHW